MLWRQDGGYLLYGRGGQGGQAVQRVVLGGRPGHGALALVVEHLVTCRVTRDII